MDYRANKLVMKRFDLDLCQRDLKITGQRDYLLSWDNHALYQVKSFGQSSIQNNYHLLVKRKSLRL